MSNFRLPGRSATKAPAAEEKPKTNLELRRDELRTRFTEMQWDLGGAAYEMAARDYFRLDVLAKMAARIQIVDAELAEIERITRLQEAGAAGACAGCGSLHARGAIYCWRCGRNVAQPQGSAVVLPAGTKAPSADGPRPAPVPSSRPAPAAAKSTSPEPEIQVMPPARANSASSSQDEEIGPGLA